MPMAAKVAISKRSRPGSKRTSSRSWTVSFRLACCFAIASSEPLWAYRARWRSSSAIIASWTARPERLADCGLPARRSVMGFRPVRCLLAAKRLETALRIRGPDRFGEGPPGVFELVLERRRDHLIEEPLRRAHRFRRVVANHPRGLRPRIPRGALVRQPIGDAELERAPSVEWKSAQREPENPLRTESTREHDRDERGHEPETGLGELELRARPRPDQVRRRDEPKSTADHWAIHGAEERDLERDEPPVDARERARKPLRDGAFLESDGAQVHARAKHISRRFEKEHAGAAVAHRAIERTLELVEHLEGERVPRLSTRQDDSQDSALGDHLDRLARFAHVPAREITGAPLARRLPETPSPPARLPPRAFEARGEATPGSIRPSARSPRGDDPLRGRSPCERARSRRSSLAHRDGASPRRRLRAHRGRGS